MVQKRRKPPKKRNSTEEREPSDGSKAPNHADTAKSIGGSPRTEWMKRWECAMEVIGLFANVATIVAIVLTGYQIVVGNWQFDRSGPDYTWFMDGTQCENRGGWHVHSVHIRDGSGQQR